MKHRNGETMSEVPDLTLLSSLYQSNGLPRFQDSYQGLDE